MPQIDNSFLAYILAEFEGLTQLSLAITNDVDKYLNDYSKAFCDFWQLISTNQGILITIDDCVVAGVNYVWVCSLIFAYWYKLGGNVISFNDNGLIYNGVQ